MGGNHVTQYNLYTMYNCHHTYTLIVIIKRMHRYLAKSPLKWQNHAIKITLHFVTCFYADKKTHPKNISENLNSYTLVNTENNKFTTPFSKKKKRTLNQRNPTTAHKCGRPSSLNLQEYNTKHGVMISVVYIRTTSTTVKPLTSNASPPPPPLEGWAGRGEGVRGPKAHLKSRNMKRQID